MRPAYRVTAEGPLAFAFGDYQIWPTSLAVTGGPVLRCSARASTRASSRSRSQNLLRLFDTVDDPGVDDEVATIRQQYAGAAGEGVSRWSAAALGAPDVLVVQEVENLDSPAAGGVGHLR